MASSAAYSLPGARARLQLRRAPATSVSTSAPAPAPLAPPPPEPGGSYLDSYGFRLGPAITVIALHVLVALAIITYREVAPAHKAPAAITMVAIPDAVPPPAQLAPPPEPVVDVPLPVVPPPMVQIAQPPRPTITVQVADTPPPATPKPASPAAPAAAATTGRAAGVDNLIATLLDGQPPEYPRQSRRLHEEGSVVLMVTVGTDGRVQSVRIDKSSGHNRLDQAALRAVRNWRWKPFLRNGAPTIVAGLVEIPFILAHRRGA